MADSTLGDYCHYATMSGMQLRAAIRHSLPASDARQPTSGRAQGKQQANVVMLPKRHAQRFLDFCRANPKPCPLLAVFPAGHTNIDNLDTMRSPCKFFAKDCDVRRDIPRYRVIRNGVHIEECDNVEHLFTDDTVTFFLGCSFGFERVMQQHGIAMRNIEQQRNVSMFRTKRQCYGGGLQTDEVVSMRWIPEAQAAEAQRITEAMGRAHGGPIHVGYERLYEHLGLERNALTQQPHFGDAVVPQPCDIPLFWSCGVTAMLAAINTGAWFLLNSCASSTLAHRCRVCLTH
jgi:uncharacterized protein YcsI (UPF0317 family)